MIESGRPEVGFIAEEVETFDPRLVAHVVNEETGEMEPASVHYNRITAYLVQITKELRDEVAALKAEIENLKNS
jgi:hypothetical protein